MNSILIRSSSAVAKASNTTRLAVLDQDAADPLDLKDDLVRPAGLEDHAFGVRIPQSLDWSEAEFNIVRAVARPVPRRELGKGKIALNFQPAQYVLMHRPAISLERYSVHMACLSNSSPAAALLKLFQLVNMAVREYHRTFRPLLSGAIVDVQDHRGHGTRWLRIRSADQIDAILADPDWLPYRVLDDCKTLKLIHLPRDKLSDLSFIDGRAQSVHWRSVTGEPLLELHCRSQTSWIASKSTLRVLCISSSIRLSVVRR